LVPAHVFAESQRRIALWSMQENSDIPGRHRTRRTERIIQGDAGEGYTRADLVARYGRENVVGKHELRRRFDRALQPDYAVRSQQHSGQFSEIVDAKAWYSRGWHRHQPADMRALLHDRQADTRVNLRGLEKTVAKYAAAPGLEPGGKVVLYFPDEILTATDLKQVVEGWSGSAITVGHPVEVRSMGAGWQELVAAMQQHGSRG
jgi:hypothetical protein